MERPAARMAIEAMMPQLSRRRLLQTRLGSSALGILSLSLGTCSVVAVGLTWAGLHRPMALSRSSLAVSADLPPHRGRGIAHAARRATVVLEPPAPPTQFDEGDPSGPMAFAECTVSASYRRGQPCGSGTCGYGVEEQDVGPEWKIDSEVWVFRQAYAEAFSVLLRKMGYHLPMIFQNVSVSCEEKALGALTGETCVDCIRHLTSDAYGEMGMIVPAHPDDALRGRRDAPPVEAINCLMQGKVYGGGAAGSALFCRSRERAGSPGPEQSL
mmetsp:Transcript_116851/g.371969  ORF Transcript_116851/g.371969 Transcript_116851/m.371969 type:complete len:270 (+) Transcript_116851:81-890(+)